MNHPTILFVCISFFLFSCGKQNNTGTTNKMNSADHTQLSNRVDSAKTDTGFLACIGMQGGDLKTWVDKTLKDSSGVIGKDTTIELLNIVNYNAGSYANSEEYQPNITYFQSLRKPELYLLVTHIYTEANFSELLFFSINVKDGKIINAHSTSEPQPMGGCEYNGIKRYGPFVAVGFYHHSMSVDAPNDYVLNDEAKHIELGDGSYSSWSEDGENEDHSRSEFVFINDSIAVEHLFYSKTRSGKRDTLSIDLKYWFNNDTAYCIEVKKQNDFMQKVKKKGMLDY